MYGRTARYYLAGWWFQRYLWVLTLDVLGDWSILTSAPSFFQHGVAKKQHHVNLEIILCAAWWLYYFFDNDGWWMMDDGWWGAWPCWPCWMMNDGPDSTWEVECPPVELKDLPPICPRWPDVDYLPESGGHKKAKGRVFWGVIKLDPFFFKGGNQTSCQIVWWFLSGISFQNSTFFGGW